MSVLNNVQHAIKLQNGWAKKGIKSCAKFNQQNGTNYVHDVSFIAPLIQKLSDEEKALLLSEKGIAILKEDFPNVQLRKSGNRSFSSFYTYILTMTEQYFGKSSVRKDISKDPFGFRGFVARPEVIAFVQRQAESALERIVIRCK